MPQTHQITPAAKAIIRRWRISMILAGISAACLALLYFLPVYMNAPMVKDPGGGELAYAVLVGLYFLLILFTYKVFRPVIFTVAFVYLAIITRYVVSYQKLGWENVSPSEYWGWLVLILAFLSSLLAGISYPSWRKQLIKRK